MGWKGRSVPLPLGWFHTGAPEGSFIGCGLPKPRTPRIVPK